MGVKLKHPPFALQQESKAGEQARASVLMKRKKASEERQQRQQHVKDNIKKYEGSLIPYSLV